MINRRAPRSLRFLGSLSAAMVLTFLTAHAAAWTTPRPPLNGSGTQFTKGFWVCYEFNGAGHTDYYSGVIPYTPTNQTDVTIGFENYVAATYHEPKQIPTCPYYTTEEQAKTALAQFVKNAKGKVVQTGWTLTGVVPPSAASAAPPATATAPPAPPASSPAPKPAPAPGADKVYNTGSSTTRYMYCWTILGDYRSFFTPTFSLDGVNPQKVNLDFVAYIRKTYGGNPSAECDASISTSASDAAQQNKMDELTRSTPKTQHLTITNVEWKPAAAPAETPAPASQGVPSAPKPSAMDAYQQAMAAQRPNGVAASMQMFCYATGAQPGGAGKAQIYVSKIFPAAPTSQPGVAFQTYLRGAHSGQIIGTATCPTAPDADTLQGTRQEYLDNQRKIPTRAVVEVDWKGGQ